MTKPYKVIEGWGDPHCALWGRAFNMLKASGETSMFYEDTEGEIKAICTFLENYDAHLVIKENEYKTGLRVLHFPLTFNSEEGWNKFYIEWS